MKKLVILLLGFVITNQSIAQVSTSEENDIKNFRFGLKGDLSIDWLNIDDRELEANGAGLGYDWGMQLEFRLNKTASIVSGFSLKSNTFKLSYSESDESIDTYYILNERKEFIEFTEENLSDSKNSLYLLNNRKIKANYINIPIALKMKTKEIGYLTYFGQFGLNIGINTKAKATDEAMFRSTPIDSTGVFLNETNEKLDLSIQPLRMGLQIGGGAEYNFSGSTSLLFGIAYNHYFTNALKNDKNEDALRIYDTTNSEWSSETAGAKALPGSLSITVGILF